MPDKNVMREYSNPNNGGRERVYRNGNGYYINSDWGRGFDGDLVEVSRRDMKRVLDFTDAPADVVYAILGEAE